MTRTLCLCALALGLFGLVLVAPQPADAGRCMKVSATASGLLEPNVAARATRKVKRAIRKGGYGSHVSPTYTKCHPTGKPRRVACAAWARACM